MWSPSRLWQEEGNSQCQDAGEDHLDEAYEDPPQTTEEIPDLQED